MASHCSILAWEIPWTEEPGRLHRPRDLKESDTTEQLSTHAFPFSPTSMQFSEFSSWGNGRRWRSINARPPRVSVCQLMSIF